jgi:hypothetical protein
MFIVLQVTFFVRFQVLTVASMKFRFVFWDVLPCKIIVDRRYVLPPSSSSLISLMMEAARTSETSVDNYFARQCIPEDISELQVTFLSKLLVPQ